MIDLKTNLINKWERNHLGHFYILVSKQNDPKKNDFLGQWIEDFLAKILEKEINLKDQKSAEEMVKNGHPDILFLKKSNPSNDRYLWNNTQNDFAPFLNFLELKNYQLKRKFVIVKDAHQIPFKISNKILKSLEEPVNTTIFFLLPFDCKLMPTIESRAIKLKISEKESLGPNLPTRNLLNDLKEDLLNNDNFNHDLVQKLFLYLKDKSGEKDLLEEFSKKGTEEQMLSIILYIGSNLKGDYTLKNGLLKSLKWFFLSSTFKNPQKERLYNLLNSSF